MSEHRLDKIVIERPRWGMRISSQRNIRRQVKQQLQQAKYDYQESEIGTLKPCYKESIRGIKTKEFSDNLNPLYQWLHSKVGQPWNAVYGELSRLLEFNTLSGQHILVHVWAFIDRDVVMIDNIPHSMPSYGRLGQDWKGKGELYIHPETGILCTSQFQLKRKPQFREDYLWLDKYHQYYKLNDIWYLVSFRDVPKPFATVIDKVRTINPTKVRDVLKGTTVTYSQLFVGKKIPTYAYHKHQCSKKEIKWIEAQIEAKLS